MRKLFAGFSSFYSHSVYHRPQSRILGFQRFDLCFQRSDVCVLCRCADCYVLAAAAAVVTDFDVLNRTAAK